MVEGKMRKGAATATAAAAAIALGPLAAKGDGLSLQMIAEGLDSPAAIATLPDGRLLVAETYLGTVRVIEPDGRVDAQPCLDLSQLVPSEWSLEEGLLDIAAAPDVETSGVVYAS